jgi:hypothetical protein
VMLTPAYLATSYMVGGLLGGIGSLKEITNESTFIISTSSKVVK